MTMAVVVENGDFVVWQCVLVFHQGALERRWEFSEAQVEGE